MWAPQSRPDPAEVALTPASPAAAGEEQTSSPQPTVLLRRGVLAAAVCLLLFALALVLASHVMAQAWEEEAGQTYDQIAAGEQVFTEACAVCHGSAGEGEVGPPLVGEGRLAGFRTAKRLFDFVRVAMPNDAPGTLAEQEYFDVVAFLLVWNGLNPENLPVDASTIGDISLQ